MINNLFEKGIRLLSKHMGDESILHKPTLFHSIRVGTYLYEKNYPQKVVIAGLLHDIIEDTEVSPEFLEVEFGKRSGATHPSQYKRHFDLQPR